MQALLEDQSQTEAESFYRELRCDAGHHRWDWSYGRVEGTLRWTPCKDCGAHREDVWSTPMREWVPAGVHPAGSSRVLPAR